MQLMILTTMATTSYLLPIFPLFFFSSITIPKNVTETLHHLGWQQAMIT